MKNIISSCAERARDLRYALVALVALVTIAPVNSWAEFEFEEDNSLPIVYLNIVLDAGAAQDPADKLGLANVASRMLLRGTQLHPKNQFFELINQLGGQIEVDVRNEGTIFRGAVLSENLEKFLSLVEETLTRPKFTSEELTKLKKEVEGLILEQKGNDQALVQYHFSRFFYGSHPYGNPILGTRKGITAINHTDVLNFYSNNFSGKTLHFFGSGAAKKGVIKNWFENLGDKLSAIHPEAKPVAKIAAPEVPSGRRALIVNKPNTTQTQVLLGGKGIRPETSGFYSILLANHSYGGASFNARMMQEIRVKRGWTYGASNSFRFGREPRHFGMYVFPKTADTLPAINLMLTMFNDYISNGIKRDEFDFAKQSLVNNAPFNFDTPRKRLENAVTEYLTGFPRGYNEELAENIAQVDYNDITPSLKAAFNDQNLTLVIVGDASKLKSGVAKLPGFSKPVIKDYRED